MSNNTTTVEKVEVIYDAVEDIKEAVAYKGVTVPAVCPIESIPALIESIETGGEQPQLNKLTLTRSNDTVTITNPSTNGGFVEGYKIYNGNSVIKTQTANTFSLIGLGAGDYQLGVKAHGTNFQDSPLSNVIKVSVCTISKSLTNLTSSNSATLISSGLPYTTKLTPANSYYLPEDIIITMGGQPLTKYSYDSYTGDLTIPNVKGNIAITAVAYNAAKLRRPKLSINGSVLSVTPPRYAENTQIYIDDALKYTYNDDRSFNVESVDGATYGFNYDTDSDGYYKSANGGVNSSYAICKIVINASYACHIALNCINGGYSSSNFGIISKLDTMLGLNTNTDSSDLYTKSFSGQHSSTNVVPVEFDVPEGEHFICVKYKRTNSNTGSYGDCLKFKVDLM